MRPDQLDYLRCPLCRAERSFELRAGEEDEREVRTGTLACGACGHEAAIEDGFADLMFEPHVYTRAGRRAYTLYKLLWGADVSLAMICTKPGGPNPSRLVARRPRRGSR